MLGCYHLHTKNCMQPVKYATAVIMISLTDLWGPLTKQGKCGNFIVELLCMAIIQHFRDGLHVYHFIVL